MGTVLSVDNSKVTKACLPVVAAGAIAFAGYKLCAAPAQSVAAESRTGISFMDVYIPSTAVQREGACPQTCAVATDREDVHSMALTVTSSLLEKSGIAPADIGYVVVATGADLPLYSSSSVSANLIQRLLSMDTEGCTITDGALGGSSALFNAVRWINSQPAEGGKSAIVVVADINMSDQKTSPFGCGAVAMVISRDAVLAVDERTSTVCRTDGANIGAAYQLFRDKASKIDRIENLVVHGPDSPTFIQTIDSIVAAEAQSSGNKILRGSAEKWKICDISAKIGDTGVANVFMNLAWLLSQRGSELFSTDIMIVSRSGDDFGSSRTGISVLRVGSTLKTKERLQKLQDSLAVKTKLLDRDVFSAQGHPCLWNGTQKDPSADTLALHPGTYFIDSFDKDKKPSYARKGTRTPRVGIESANAVVSETSTAASTSRTSKSGSESGKKNTAVVRKTSAKFSEHAPSMRRNSQSYVWASGRLNVEIVVTGVSAGLPGRDGSVFPKPGSKQCNIQRIIGGENFISSIPDSVKDSMLEKNVVKLSRSGDGKLLRNPVTEYAQCVNVCASIGEFDLTRYGVSESIASTMDKAVQVSVAAGLEALRDAGIVTGVGEGTSGWVLPLSMQQTTGVVYATSFPALDTAISEVSRFFRSKLAEQADLTSIIDSLRVKMQARCLSVDNTDTDLPGAVEAALQNLKEYLDSTAAGSVSEPRYEFDRKFLFRVLVLGNAQLAQIVKAKGPNMQTNAACAGSTQAVAFAYDMIQVGRAQRMIVIAGDNASSDNLMPWLGNGFLALGAATTQADVATAALPFDVRRTGMILGSGSIGMILESEEGAKRRHAVATQSDMVYRELHPSSFKCRVLGTLYSNSAFHGASLDRKHIAEELERFIASIEFERGISRNEIAAHGVYFSHETCTNAEPSKSCASNEIFALREVFGAELSNLLILNTKGLTGHSMGVSFEDVVAAEVLVQGKVPPVANLQQPDPFLGADLKYSSGGEYECKYALRFAAGFGSQVAIALYGKY